MSRWVPLPSDHQLQPGDVIRFWSRAVGVGTTIKAVQVEEICRRIEKRDPRFRVVGNSWPDADNKFSVRVMIVDPPAATEADLQYAGILQAAKVLAVLGTIVSGVIVGRWMVHHAELLLEAMERVGDETRKTIGTAAAGVGLVVGLLVLYQYMKKRG